MPPASLESRGYVEEEFFVSGSANVYNWASDGSLGVVTSAAPYVTRILVRRPAQARRFSGAVVVEPLYTPRRWDWPMMWGYLNDQIVQDGDAWVGITMPGAVSGLQKFDPARYGRLSFKNPAPDAACPGVPAAGVDVEDGLKWDAISQVGALLKSEGGPFRGFKVDALYLTVQGGDLTTYMMAIQPRATLAGGKPVYDGFLARSTFALTRISRCAPQPAANDPRQIVKNVGVPVIAVSAEGDVPATYAARRDDSDERGDRYRLYEIAGAGHIDKFAYVGFPSMDDQRAAGNAQGTPEWPFAAPCDPAIPLMDASMLKVSYDAALVNLDRWARKGVIPPRAPRLETTDSGSGQIRIAADDFGNGRGGVRTPQVDVPLATYVTGSTGAGNCREIGHAMPFPPERVNALYGDRRGYEKKVTAAIDRLAADRWLTPADARRLKQELAR